MNTNRHHVARFSPGAPGTVTGNPRPDPRCRVPDTLHLKGVREVHAEPHHDGTVLPAANVSWHATRDLLTDGLPAAGLTVSQDFIGACCRGACATAYTAT